jgi:hypothetical protein
VLYALGYYDEARSSYTSCLQAAEKTGLSSLVPKVYINLGMSLEAEGMLMNACEYYRWGPGGRQAWEGRRCGPRAGPASPRTSQPAQAPGRSDR